MQKFRFITTLAVLAFASSVALGGVVDFATLTGSNGDPFSTYTENGFTVNSTTGSWQKAFLFGNPVPDIFSGSSTASITVTGGAFNGTFNLISFDFGNSFVGSGLAWSAAGFRNSVQVLSGSGSGPATTMFVTVASPDSSAVLDALVLTATLGNTAHYNFDNLVLNSVPEPSTITLLAAGFLLAHFYRRRR